MASRASLRLAVPKCSESTLWARRCATTPVCCGWISAYKRCRHAFVQYLYGQLLEKNCKLCLPPSVLLPVPALGAPLPEVLACRWLSRLPLHMARSKQVSCEPRRHSREDGGQNKSTACVCPVLGLAPITRVPLQNRGVSADASLTPLCLLI